MEFEVILNKWSGKGFENDTRCDLCSRMGHVVVMPTMEEPQLVCQGCLNDAICAIYAEVMKSLPRWRDPRSGNEVSAVSE